MAIENDIAAEDRPKVYLETSFSLICPAIITPRSYLEDFRHEG